MGAGIESSVVIARPVAEVFGFFTDLEKSAKVYPDVESVEKTSEGPVGQGTMFRVQTRGLGKSRESMVRFTAFEPNRRVETQGKVGPIRPRMIATFEEADGGTRLTVSGDANPVGPFKLLSGRIRRIGQRLWDERLAHLKAALEAPETPGREPGGPSP